MKKTIFFLVFAFTTGSLFLFNTGQVNAAKPSDYGLKEGDLISAIFSDDPDVYIINDNGYKRLFLNPEIFKFYGHLGGFVNVKLVTPEVRDAFITSGLFRNCENNDQKVYGVDIDGEDSGQLHWVNSSGEQAVKDDPDFFKKVFCINGKEFSWYPKGNVLNTVKDVPSYERVEIKEAISTEKKLETNTSLKEKGKVVICHYPTEAPNKLQEITISASALKAHLEHGDIVGACPPAPSVACTMDAKLCPDGSYVSRIGPKCEFASCPVYPTPKPTCLPRPTCLDATPRCLLSEPPGGWCPAYTPTPIPTQGYVSIVSPNGGEVFQKGTTRLIKWNSANISKIYIKLRKGSDTYPGSEGMITDVISNIGGYYTWMIPTTLPDGNDYSVRVIDGNFTGMLDDSDAPFSIVTTATQTPTPAPTTSPLPVIKSLRVIFPNGGETWYMGKTYDILWESSGVEKVYIAANVFRDGVSVGSLGIASSADNVSAASGKYSWTPNSRHLLEGNQIKIEVSNTEIPASGVSTPETLPSDESDNYFSIVEVPVSTPTSTTSPLQ